MGWANIPISMQPRIISFPPEVVPGYEQLRDQILARSHSAFVIWARGAGKTYLTCRLQVDCGYNLFVICPAQCVSVWEKMEREYGIRITIISYESFRGSVAFPPTHGWIIGTVHKAESEKKKDKLKYVPGVDLLNRLKAETGTLFVFDECDALRNPTSINSAVRALTHALISTPDTKCRALYLSAQPGCTPEHAVALMRAAGYIQKRKLFDTNRFTGGMELLGFQELAQACLAISREHTLGILGPYVLPDGRLGIYSKELVKELTDRLYHEVILHNLAPILPPLKLDHPPYYRNTFMDIVDMSKLQRLLALQSSIGRAARHGEPNGVKRDYGAVEHYLREHNEILAETAIHHILRLLRSDPRAKVVTFCDHTPVNDAIYDAVKAITNAIKLVGEPKARKGQTRKANGAVPRAKRGSAVEQFQTDPNTRAIVCNSTVGGRGHSFHDLVGDEERYVIIFPSYKFLDIFQCMGRTARRGALSKTNGWIIYGPQGAALVRILDNLTTKSEYSKKYDKLHARAGGEVVSGPQRPGDFPQVTLALDGTEAPAKTQAED